MKWKYEKIPFIVGSIFLKAFGSSRCTGVQEYESDFSKTLQYLVSTSMFGVAESYVSFVNDTQMKQKLKWW
jgi:hypothetical protein